MDRLTQQRIAENDSRFRDANERIREVAEQHGVQMAVPFICECAEPTCVEIVRLELHEYRSIRANPRWFLTVPGHDGEAGRAGRTVSEHDGYVVIEKLGHAGEVTEELTGGSAPPACAHEDEG